MKQRPDKLRFILSVKPPVGRFDAWETDIFSVTQRFNILDSRLHGNDGYGF